MNCPSCGKRWKVKDSRHADSLVKEGLTSWAFDSAALVSWYSQDWVARRRVCGCGNKATTLELPVEDLVEVLREFRSGDPPDDVVKQVIGDSSETDCVD